MGYSRVADLILDDEDLLYGYGYNMDDQLHDAIVAGDKRKVQSRLRDVLINWWAQEAPFNEIGDELLEDMSFNFSWKDIGFSGTLVEMLMIGIAYSMAEYLVKKRWNDFEEMAAAK